MIKSKYLVRRARNLIGLRFEPARTRFTANARKLQAAQTTQKELIDVMPGIELPMVIHPSMYFRRAYTDAIFEPNTLHFIRDHLRSGQIVVDVGANIGYFSLLFAKTVGPAGRVMAFEPGEFAFNLLQRNCELNRFDWLEVYPIGLAETRGVVVFNSGPPGMEVYNSISETHFQRDISSGAFQKVNIQVFDGDTWFRDHAVNYIDLMKIDVEGGEYAVLCGLKSMLREHRIARLLIEVTAEMAQAFGYAPTDITNLLHDCGYIWYQLRGGGELTPFDGHFSLKYLMLVAMLQE
jgi:FkbM family methyltransferase